MKFWKAKIDGGNKMKLEAFVVRYYLPNQSELFSEPQVYIAKTWQDLVFAINTAQKNNYEIVGIDAGTRGENGVEVKDDDA